MPASLAWGRCPQRDSAFWSPFPSPACTPQPVWILLHAYLSWWRMAASAELSRGSGAGNSGSNGQAMSVTQFVRALVSGVHLPSRMIPAQPAPPNTPPAKHSCCLFPRCSRHRPLSTARLGFFMTALIANNRVCVHTRVCVSVCTLLFPSFYIFVLFIVTS